MQVPSSPAEIKLTIALCVLAVVLEAAEPITFVEWEARLSPLLMKVIEVPYQFARDVAFCNLVTLIAASAHCGAIVSCFAICH